jgi:hypothetical protein
MASLMTLFEARSNLTGTDQNEARSKKVRGRNKATIKLVEAMREIAEESKPITGRGIGYKLFTRGLIGSMSEMPKVYRHLVNAREDGIIPWPWIVDESRELEQVHTWDNGAVFASRFFYRRNLWQTQEKTTEVWSEKGTVRGLLWPVLAKWGVGFRVLHGFASATTVWEACNQVSYDNRPLVALYIGDCDPSGLYMSERDLPERIAKYEGDHIVFRKIAVTKEQAEAGSLPSFSVEDKKRDKRYRWFKENFGNRCWELDAVDPDQLRDLVENEIKELIDDEEWDRQEAIQEREQKSIDTNLRGWSLYERSLAPHREIQWQVPIPKRAA